MHRSRGATDGGYREGRRYRCLRRTLLRGRLCPISLSLNKRAAEIAVRHRLRGADSVYVATAESHNAMLVTWDQEMLDREAVAISTKIVS